MFIVSLQGQARSSENDEATYESYLKYLHEIIDFDTWHSTHCKNNHTQISQKSAEPYDDVAYKAYNKFEYESWFLMSNERNSSNPDKFVFWPVNKRGERFPNAPRTMKQLRSASVSVYRKICQHYYLSENKNLDENTLRRIVLNFLLIID